MRAFRLRAPMDWLLLSVALLQVLSLGWGLPGGAPSSACEDMMPRHMGVLPQPAPAPYTIQTSSKGFQAGQPMNVIITGPNYKGVLLEARSGSSTRALGSWEKPPLDTKLLLCSGNQQGAVTHSNTNDKSNSTVYTWIPPAGTNTIFFMATVAQQRTIFWFNVRSATLSKVNLGLTAAAPPLMSASGFLLLLSFCLLGFQAVTS